MDPKVPADPGRVYGNEADDEENPDDPDDQDVYENRRITTSSKVCLLCVKLF